MLESQRKPSRAPFIVHIPLLAAVTYLESALLEYPVHWLGPSASLAVLAAMVAVQVALCANLYRGVRRNGDIYSTFVRRASLLVLAAYLAFTVIFLLPDGIAFVHHDIGSLAAIGGGAA